ncbi:hypothetical protein PQ462_04180 [Flavobacterium sp. KACC 22758]|uniref:hypothetical protein n=1 Tax=Flavobacterium sp. KACC 22758 TaxID=3025667 RepID=UPI0023650C7E|nr:hypothetical protein [Flavobacterium sp. KACC 22758]WDF60572.1 hypothetical protein PQ462_04180 [Flavobacterium sp. KACC 22758]
MKSINILFLIFIFNFANGQELKSHSFIKKESNIVDKTQETKITITDSEIILKNYSNNNTKDLIRRIERSETKAYNGINSIWYYCIAVEKDIFRSEYRKSIFIYDKLGKTLIFADFPSEVDVTWTKFLL